MIEKFSVGVLFLPTEKGGDYQSVKTLNYIAPPTGLVSGAQKSHQPPSDETQSDGVGIFAKFRGTNGPLAANSMYSTCMYIVQVHVYMYTCSYLYCTCIYTMYV